MTLTIALDLAGVKKNQQAKCLGQRSFRLTVIFRVGITDRLLTWTVIICTFLFRGKVKLRRRDIQIHTRTRARTHTNASLYNLPRVFWFCNAYDEEQCSHALLEL